MEHIIVRNGIRYRLRTKLLYIFFEQTYLYQNTFHKRKVNLQLVFCRKR